MAVIETKFSVGDVVWYASTTTERKQHPCPDCNGEKRWKAISPAGNEYTFGCPRCSTRYSSFDKLNINYTAHVPTAHCLTIGSVRHESATSFGGGPKTQYMCVETGVGSSNLYDEDRLFETQEAALAAAGLIADKANSEIPHIVERYNSALEISDYQLESALLKAAKDEESRVRSLTWRLEDLFSQIEEADDKDAILEVVDDYKRYSWDRAKASFAKSEESSHAH